ncbi:hypothetical protein D3P09_11115 [Paenibacillus pinisoli]|uniref:Uncharacterized protein n=1 Tax=Paenibacillus pinisoli TaxID=1276110 RepID=A0A3A6PE67_9BACL|nr:hypothetical protein [Paenibacillus pinisoli]RJX39932.1 hypothetical protein D3P09_11115 [Paenibacillus pinisoli]
MKKVILLVLIAMFAFTSSASAAYTVVSQDTRYGLVGHSKYAYSVTLSGEPNTQVTVTLMYKGPWGQLDPITGSSVTVTLNAGGYATVNSPDLYCCSASNANPYDNPVVVQAQFQGSYGSVFLFSLQPKY